MSQAFVELNNAGPIPAVLQGFNATLRGPEGLDIGWLVFPDIKLDANSANLQDVISTLTILNQDKCDTTLPNFKPHECPITTEGIDLLAGRSVTWTVKGDTVLTALGFGSGPRRVGRCEPLKHTHALPSDAGFHVHIDKPLTFPGVLLENFLTKNVQAGPWEEGEGGLRFVGWSLGVPSRYPSHAAVPLPFR